MGWDVRQSSRSPGARVLGWARRAAELRDQLGEVAELDDPRWWLVAGGAAVDWTSAAPYLASDAEPSADTFLGHVAPAPADPIADAIARAHAARAAIRALDGALPGQPLAVTVRRGPSGATTVPSRLDVAAFAIEGRTWCAALASHLADERALADDLAGLRAGRTPSRLSAPGTTAIPFVTVTVGEEPLETARHGHRRGWIGEAGPWLGLGTAGGLAIASTCHMVVDGYGHARLAGLLAAARLATTPGDVLRAAAPPGAPPSSWSAAPAAIPLGIAWRPLAPPSPRALPLAYALGRLLHRLAGRPRARFSPTFQIPVAPGAPDDPLRRRRRVVPAMASVRFDGGAPEPFARFEARSREILAREARGHGVSARLLQAAQAMPAPLAWKRRAVSARRPRWLEPVADVIGGRGCVSRITVDVPMPASCAVSSPARLAGSGDSLGGCVVTVVDDGTRAAVTLCGSGAAGTSAAASDLLDELLSLVP